MKTNILIIITSILLGCDSQVNDESDTLANFQQLMVTEQYKSISGVDDDLLSLDIHYRNDTDFKKPVVIYVHGGAWRNGDKSNSLKNKINLFSDLNYDFVSINYRLSPFSESESTPDRIKYPVHNIDVADAIKWVIENISEYGGNNEKIGLLGHSAGAHLVALTGTNYTFIQGIGYDISDIKGVAIIDTEGYDVRSEVLEGNKMNINAFGTVEQENIDASPLYNVSSNINNAKFFVAKRGTSLRIAIADRFIQELNDKNIETYEVNGREYYHNGINNAIGNPGHTIITPALIAFFESCFE